MNGETAMTMRSVDEGFLNSLFSLCSALLTGGEPDPAASCPDTLVSCLKDCFSLGFQTDDLRSLHASVLQRVRGTSIPGCLNAEEDILLFPAVILSAESFQLEHEGSLHAHAVGAIVASICKLPYVDTLGGKPREEKLTLREELYHGADSLLMKVLDLEGLSFFAAPPAPEDASSYLRAKLGIYTPDSHTVLRSLCAGACILSAFHREEKNRHQLVS